MSRANRPGGAAIHLKMVGPVVGHNVEAKTIFRHRLHVAGQQVDLGRELGLVSVVDVQVAIAHLAPAALPNVSQPSL